MSPVIPMKDAVPDEIRERISSPYPQTRLDGVARLADLAGGTDPQAAAAARDALRDLVEDDSRSVGAAASQALLTTSVRLDPPRLDFGKVPPGTPRLVVDVAVSGPPLAQSSTVIACGEGLRATLQGGGIRVSWRPGAGAFTGTVTVTGPAGSAELPVTGEVAAGPMSVSVAAARRKALDGLGGLDTAARPTRPEPAAVRAPFPVWPVAAAVVLVVLVGSSIFAVLARDRDAASAPVPVATSRPPVIGRAVSTPRPTVLGTIRVGIEPEGVAVSPDSRTLYVADQGSRTLFVVDVGTRAVTPVPLRNTARFVAVSRDGTQVFVSMYEDDKSGSGVAVVDAAGRRVLRYLATGEQPYDLAVAPDGRLWVPIHSRRKVELYTAGSQKPDGSVLVRQNPHSVAFASDGARAFTPDHESNSVSVIDMRTDRRITSIAVSAAPHSVAVTPDGRTVVVACYLAGAVDLIDAVTLRRTGPFRVGDKPQSVAVSVDGAHAYVVNEADNSVTVIDPRTGTVTATVPTGRSPRTVAVSPDGRLAYVSNGDSGSVSIVDVAG